MKYTLTAMMCGTAALLAANAPGQAVASTAPTTPPTPQSYAELLDPIPNALALLRIDDASHAQQTAPVQVAQYYDHHHHHRYRRYHHHHHHRYRYAPNCYWAWGAAYWNGYRWVRPRVRVCR